MVPIIHFIHYDVFYIYYKQTIIIFQRKGVLGNFVLIEEFCCFLFPLENDLMSMEMNNCYKVFIYVSY